MAKDWNKTKLSKSDFDFIKKILLTIETINKDIISYCYLDGNINKTYTWWVICVSDFNWYMHDKTFLKLKEKWRNLARSRSIKLVFMCGWVPSEEKLLKLSEEDNLIMNI